MKRLSPSLITLGVQKTKFTGKGVKVAVLDSGLSASFPNADNIIRASQNFVPTESIEDRNGHGTHCAGLVCGYQERGEYQFGSAPDCILHVGKVVNAKGIAHAHALMSGLEWAVENKCQVILISLGLSSSLTASFSYKFENVVRAAKEQGSLIVGSAGNHSNRRLGRLNPVAHPANCPTVITATAIDDQMQIYQHANTDKLKEHDNIDFAAPGVDVESNWYNNMGSKMQSGTSVAAALLAGVLALYFEAFPHLSIDKLLSIARKNALPLNNTESGAGLIQAPV